MFLNRLEVVGFKSFAERVKIEFNEGITAVVGPNGSGKSNIIDAIRWVLGEQSARSLRGQRMEDIIFQGSDSRTALNFAEVSLILNNDHHQLPIDYKEVSITRRVYRSGESDFYINKQACRLKDIVDLFTDTGLGKESFSIIGQGKIDEILSSKAEERRAIFEEAAGVLKYKQRKVKAEYKLNETQDNLLRVEDIIHEINTQLSPLEKQAEKAKQYNEYRDALSEVEISLLVTEIETLHMKWQGMLKEIEEKRMAEVQLSSQMKQDEAIIIEKQQQLQAAEEAITTLQKKLVDLTEHVEQLEGKRNVLLERKKHVQENKTSMLKNKQVTNDRFNQLEEQLAMEKSQQAELIEAKQAIEKQMATIEHMLEHGIEAIQEQIEQLKSDYIDLLNERAVNQNNAQALARKKDQLLLRKEKETVDHESVLQNNVQFKKQTEALEMEVAELKKQQGHEETNYEIWKTDVQTERDLLTDMQQKLYAGNEQIAKLRARKETLEEMKDSFQGYFYSVKEILRANQKGKLTHLFGAVIDLITVPEKYITAIDTILGAQAQHIVCKDDNAARNAITWLKKENKGRATFLPIASLQERQVPQTLLPKIKEVDGFISIASDVIETDERFQKVIKHLIGNVIMTKDLQAATKIAHITNRRFRIVTLEGDVVYPGGSMSGGAKKSSNQSSLFTREKELVTLTDKIARFEERATAFANQVREKQLTVSHLIDSETMHVNRINETNESLQAKQAALQEMTMKLRVVQDDLAVYEMQMDTFATEETEVNESIMQNEAALERIQQQIETVEAKIDELTSEQERFQLERQAKEATFHSLEKSEVELRERLKNINRRMEETNATLHEVSNEAQMIDDELEQMEQLEKGTIHTEEIAAQVRLQKEARDQAIAQLEAKRQTRSEIAQDIADVQLELKAKEKIHHEKVTEIQTKEVQANRLDVTLENYLNRLQTEYVTTFERASLTYDRVDDVEAAKQMVAQLKQAIDRLGTVNLGAIEEYDRLLERYEFLQEQKDDLLEAKATLYAVIKEMDEEMVKRFSDMFVQVQVAFSDVFKKLFGGGHAELVLTDKDDLLETGIEIIASPPGKKQKALSLLSGGERALTAIALLFAILRVKPVPFCILDEVDASLDEANVARFSNYLNHYSDGTQFIVITHRKGTMEEANVLYGVTMQESGVSRLVSVRLEDAEELASLS